MKDQVITPRSKSTASPPLSRTKDDLEILRPRSVSPLSDSPQSRSPSPMTRVSQSKLSIIPDSPHVSIPTLEPHSPSFVIAQEHFNDIPEFPAADSSMVLESRPLGIPSSPSSPSKTTTSSSIDDQITEKITSILSNIPAKIRLTSGPEPEGKEPSRRTISAQLKAHEKSTPPPKFNRSVSATPSITLAPARAPKIRSSSGDSDIKLYHLHQPGKDKPIKLYVRLVGEGEQRVMVRVGGGWADLGVYLQEYANHHGHRAVSEGKFEIKGLPSTQSAASVTTLSAFSNDRTTPGSRPGTPDHRPSSSLAIRKTRRTSGAMPITPEMVSKTWDAVPSSAESHASSVRSSSRLSWTDDDAPLGMAGPTSKKKVEMDEKKKAWVDGMMHQARQVSHEMKRSPNGVGAEVGDVGGTRRVFLRGKVDE